MMNTDRYSSRVRLAVDRDLLDVAVSGSSGSKSQSTERDDENVLSERRVKHGDRLSDGKMRCTEVLRRANVSEMKILIETVVMKRNPIDQEARFSYLLYAIP